MNKILNLEDVWDNRAIAQASLSGEEIDRFKSLTNARRVVARRWICQGKQHQTPYFVRLLPDETGLVHYESNDPRSKCLIVLSGDESIRVVIGVPHVDANFRPGDGYLSLPPSSSRFGGIEWGYEGNDGHTDYLFDFDWSAGKLLRFARPSRPW